MPGAFIGSGDKTSHGGTVIEAAPTTTSGDIALARHGDKAACAAALSASQQATMDLL
jgi:uncharacterized Zn-binding protein involved in type VI secretion